jgi:hypothetical protein
VVIIFHFVLHESTQRFALAAGGRDEIKLREQKKPEARKMPENAAESHQSAAPEHDVRHHVLPKKQAHMI